MVTAGGIAKKPAVNAGHMKVSSLMNSAGQVFPHQPGYRGCSSSHAAGKALVCRAVAAMLVWGAVASGAGIVLAKGPAGEGALVGKTMALAELPKEGRLTYALIAQGGPFPFDKDGTVFGNRERLLPRQKNGYYLEYTVKTPGMRSRGAKRIVCGGQARQPDACYYTADHYASFRQIVN